MARLTLAAVLVAATAAVMVGSPATAKTKPRPKVHPPAWTLRGHGGFAFGFGSAWIAGGGTVLRVNPRTNRVTATITNAGTWPIARPDGIWTIENLALDRIDPARNKVVLRIRLSSSGSLAYGFGSFWVATGDGSVLRVDPVARKVVATIPVQHTPNWSPQIAAGEGAVWVASADKHEVAKIDPATNTIASSTPVGGQVDSLLTVAAAYGSVWAHENAAAQGRGLLYRIDPATGKLISTLTTSKASGGGYGGTNIALGAGSIWTSNGNGTVSRVAADGRKVSSAVQTPFLAEFIAVGLGSVWVQSDSGQTARIPLARFPD